MFYKNMIISSIKYNSFSFKNKIKKTNTQFPSVYVDSSAYFLDDKKQNKNNNLQFDNCTYDLIQIKNKEKHEEELFEKFINKSGKVTKKDYDYILKKHPKIIDLAYKKIEPYLATDYLYTKVPNPEIIAKSALNIKDFIEKSYKNYKIISVGTSASSISEALKNLGCDVIFLSISGIAMYEQNNANINYQNVFDESNSKYNLIHIYDYLKSKGIDENMQDSEVIILDYTNSGITLNCLKTFMDNNFNLSPKQIHKASIILTLLNNKNSKYRVNAKEIIELDRAMSFSSVSSVSNTAHFYLDDVDNRYPPHYQSGDCIPLSSCENQADLFKKLDKFSKPLARAYSLCVLNEIKKIQDKSLGLML